MYHCLSSVVLSRRYLSSASKLPAKKWYNDTGAGFPDVAAQAENFQIVYGGATFGVAGTRYVH